MICVSIGRGRHKQMIAEHHHLVEQGAQLVELRLDYIRRDVSLHRLLKDRPSPVVMCCRRESDGGRWTGTESARQILLRSAIVEGVDYIDLEDDVAKNIRRYGKTKRIISYHNFQEMPENLEEIHERMCELDPDIVKLAVMAHRPYDNVRMLRLTKLSKVPMIGICMGDMGIPSRILAGKYGAPFTYATFHHERSLAPGQLSFKQMREVYGYENINAETQVYGVVADPVAHSLSPLVHNAAFRHLNLNKVYLPFRVPDEYLDDFLDVCDDLEVKGLSVTIPHKESAMRFVQNIEGPARDIGAINTILFDEDERKGFNTDYHAAMDSIAKGIGETEGSKPMAGRVVLILGAGGAARAIAYGMKKREADVIIASRTELRAKELAQQLSCRWVDWNARHSIKPSLLINCTPVGMHPNVDETPYHKHYLRPQMIVFDTVYNPEQTLLIKEARETRCRTVSGVDMFVRQAAMQFKLFTKQSPPVAIMLDQVRRAIGAARYHQAEEDQQETTAE